TGIEYAVAALLIYEGEVDAGLEIVGAVRARHDGVHRNPWDEFECGHHYARALSSWSVLLALQGYHYSAPQGLLRFAPRVGAGSSVAEREGCLGRSAERGSELARGARVPACGNRPAQGGGCGRSVRSRGPGHGAEPSCPVDRVGSAGDERGGDLASSAGD